MLSVLSGFPDNVLAIAASGEVTGKDYQEVLVPAVLARLKAHRQINLYYRIGDGFSGFSAAAMWEDAKVGFAHWTHWGRIAVVTDVTWIANAVRLFTPMFHRPVRVFGNDKEDAARAWISQDEAQAA